jgi:glutamine amidotransferase
VGVRIAVVDVGLGNLRSVERAVREAARHAGEIEVEVTRDPAHVRAADKLVMPGQGGFGECAAALAGPAGLGDAVRETIARGTPYLGICLGLQVLFAASDEGPGAGLGVLPGRVVRLAGGIDPTTGAPLKVPHVGWNTADPDPACAARANLLRGRAAEHFYFVHSYVAAPDDPRVVAATTEYGARFVSAVARDDVFACQFHPEKSGGAGLRLLEGFVRGEPLLEGRGAHR